MPHRTPPTRVGALLLAASALALGACRPTRPTTAAAPATALPPGRVPLVAQPPIASLDAHRVVPAPARVVAGPGAPFTLTAASHVVVAGGDTAAARVGAMLAAMLRPPTGFSLPVAVGDGASTRGAIVLRVDGAAALGEEGYALAIGPDSLRLTARSAAGLFRGAQTLRQLLPASVEAEESIIHAPVAWTIPPGEITDAPRFAWRGGMLDVARHFFTVDEVKQYVDLLALYKLNVLHLHLSDDQGWRVQIDAWPRLATVGGASEVGGGPGGFYTKGDYGEIVRYAAERFITVVPEIDLPGHTQAAIAAYPELGCSRPLPEPASLNAPVPGLYTNVRVGFSALCPDREATWRFVEDVVRELAAMTPGPYLHLGGDEVMALRGEQYNTFVERAQEIVARHGKRMIGWDEIGHARLRPGTVAQIWRADTAQRAARQGAPLVMSPATRTYLDMRYTPATEIGHRWAAFIPLRTAYDWDPTAHFPGTPPAQVLGVEAPLWTETVPTLGAAQYLLLPRLPALAEVAWTAQAARDWERFRTRIAAHAPRWRFLGMNFHAAPEVAW